MRCTSEKIFPFFFHKYVKMFQNLSYIAVFVGIFLLYQFESLLPLNQRRCRVCTGRVSTFRIWTYDVIALICFSHINIMTYLCLISCQNSYLITYLVDMTVSQLGVSLLETMKLF